MTIYLLNKFDCFNKHNNSFCDKKFKYLSFALDYMSSVCSSLVYRLISISLAFDYTPYFKNRDRHFVSLAECENNKIKAIKTKFLIYHKYGSEIVDFSENGGTLVDKTLLKARRRNDFCLLMAKLKISQSARSHPDADYAAEVQALKHMYGDKTIEAWIKHFQLHRFLHRDRTLHGCCHSMSMDFISSYLKQVRAGKAPLETIKAIAPKYKWGATKKMQLAQIFYSALIHRVRNHYVKRIDQLRQFYLIKSKRTVRLPLNEQNTALNNLTSQCLERSAKLKNHAKIAKVRVFHKIESALGIAAQPGITQRFVSNAFQGKNPPGFENFIRNLSSGVYKVELDSPEAIEGHSIAFIKSSRGDHFIFDPNFATFKVNPSHCAARLWELARMGKFNTFNFTCYSLLST